MKPHHPNCISSTTHKMLCMKEEEVTEQRRVRKVEAPRITGVVLAEFGDFMWVAGTQHESPITYRKSTWEDIPGDPPKVGELWAYEPYTGYGYIVVAVTDTSWSFVRDWDIPKSFEDAKTTFRRGGDGKEKSTDTALYTRKLPETAMKKVEKND